MSVRTAPPRLRCAALLGLALATSACTAQGASGQPAPLALERRIPLPDVKGRIDHMALDVAGRRLFVAALGNGTVEVVDLAGGRVAARVRGLTEPQGLGFLPDRQELVVASGGDGSVRFYRGSDLSAAGQIDVGGDTDNVRVDAATHRIVVGAEVLAVIDPQTRSAVGKTSLPAHAEGFQLDGQRVYVNLPNAGAIAVADLAAGKVVTTWPNKGRRWNFPLAIDHATGEVAVVYRLPARLVVFDPKTGVERQALETCGDSDDLFFDSKRSRLYVACGDGHVDVFAREGSALQRIARIATSPGARTAFFSPDLDRLFVAARARGAESAAILVYRPE